MNQYHRDYKKTATQYNKAVGLRKEGRDIEAVIILRQIVDLHPDLAAAHNFLGSILWKKGDLDEAITCFIQAVKNAPKWELASRALFHTLYEKGQKDRAFAEIRRFLSVSDSKEYSQILNDLNLGLVKSPGNYLKISDNHFQN